MNLYTFNPELDSDFMGHEENDPNELINQDPFPFPFPYCNDLVDTAVPNPLNNECHVPGVNLNTQQNQLPLPLVDGEPIEVPDIPDTCFNFISNILREEGSDDRPNTTLQDYMDAQVSYNKSLDAALLGETCSFLANQRPPPVCQTCPFSCFDDNLNLCSGNNSNYGTVTFDNTNFAQNSFVGNSGCGLGTTFGRNIPLGGDIGLLEPVTQLYDQGCASIQNSSWGSVGVSLSNQVNDQGVRVEQPRVNNLVDVHGLNMNMYSNTQLESALQQNFIAHLGIVPSHCSNSCAEDINRIMNSQATIDNHNGVAPEFVGCSDSSGKSRGRKHVEGDAREDGERMGRSSKHLAPSNEVFEQIEKYGDVLLCPEGRSKPAGLCSSITISRNSEAHKLQKDGISLKGSKKRGNTSPLVDLKSLLMRCAQCVAKVDLVGAYEVLDQIRQNSSPYGNYLQRVAHYLGNGLQARLEGKGSELSRANEQIPPCEVLKANRIYVASIPYKIMSYYTTNKTIAKLVEDAPSIHIIDFGIYYGLQWPCIIQNLSKRPSGPPRIRITGIDFPQPGFRPSDRVEETGRCLAKYCERYNVPFEYHAIAKNWDTIKVEELNIERNEPLAVNCLYRSHNLYDESVEEHSPRDAFLSLVRQINPDIFMHGVVNSTSSVPFFLNRFKEVMFHYTALFDMFEATMNREDNERLLMESKLYGNQALNVIACEGVERVERPESYKQWQVRTQRAGFVQVPLDRELLKRARAMVRRNFREEFSYDEDGHWVVQGWKGRILYAISCWKPQEV